MIRRNFCLCFLKFHSNAGSSISTIVEFVFISFIIAIGIAINLKFRTKLLDEKKQMPIGRRGNVVAPVMNVFCLLQIVFWPFDLILLWGITNVIVPVDSIHPKLCVALVMTLKSGRMCIAYHSLFVALIRYMHIVKDKILNQWNYERVAKHFKIFCIIFPLPMEFALIKEIGDCMGFAEELNDGANMEEQTPFISTPSRLAKWTMKYLPAPLMKALSIIYAVATVSVSANVIEVSERK